VPPWLDAQAGRRFFAYLHFREPHSPYDPEPPFDTRFGPDGPSPESRRASAFTVVAEARGPGGEGRAVLEGSDPYGLTALLLVRGAQMLQAGEARGTGVLAPAEAFDARTLVGRLTPFLTIAE